MNDPQYRHPVLRMLVENEETVAELYRIYADKFPRRRDFWNDLAHEEIQHSLWIQNLSAETGLCFEIKEDRFTADMFQVSQDYLKERLARAKNEKMALKEALTTALDIETGLLERGYFEVFEGDTPELTRVLNALAAETERHTNKIRKELGRKRWGFF